MEIKSGKFPLIIFRHEGQQPQLSPSTGASQFNAIAKAMAVLVFPTPAIPVNRYAWGIFSLAITCFKKRFAFSWPIIWENDSKKLDLYF
jgi:hypothetical protein